MTKEEKREYERFLIGKTIQFADTFEVNKTFTADELGKWFVENTFFDGIDVDPTDPDRTKNGEWHVYLKERTAAIKAINRVAIGDDYIVGERRPGFQLKHIGNGDYQVLPFYDSVYEWTQDYARKLRGYMGNKQKEHRRQTESEAFNLLPAAERELIERRQILLEHSLTVAANSVELLLKALDPDDKLLEG